MLSAGEACRDAERRQPLLLLTGALDVERIVTRDLDADTAARGVNFLGERIVQVSRTIPPGRRAAVALHFLLRHTRRCQASSCLDARVWLADVTDVAESIPLASA